MLKEEYIEKIIYASKKEKFITFDLLEEILYSELVINDSFVQETFKSFKMADLDDAYGLYDQEGNIVLDISTIESKLSKKNSKNIEAYLGNNLFKVFVLMHEFAHLKEDYKLERNLYLEDEILSLCSFDVYHSAADEIIKNYSLLKRILLKNQKMYYETECMLIGKIINKVYEVNPCEKIANYDSYSYLIEGLTNYENFSSKYFNTFKKIVNEFYDEILVGYKMKNGKINVPILDYLKGLKLDDFIKYLSLYDEQCKSFDKNEISQIDLFERAKLNLPITRDEYRYIRSLKMK